MEITEYKIQKNNERVSVFVDNEYSFSVTKENFLKHNLKVGLQITEEQIEALEAEDEREKAFSFVLFQLGYGIKTEKELVQKMESKHYSPEAQYYAITKAKKYGYVNDTEYCESFISQHKNLSGWGEKKIISELYRKGIPTKLAKSMLEKFYTDDEIEENAYKCALKKYETLKNKETDKYKIKQKLYMFLGGRGYSYDVIQTVIDRLVQTE